VPGGRRHSARLAAISADADARWVLSTERTFAALRRNASDYPALAGTTWLNPSDIADDEAELWVPPDIGPETLALLQYTSGSTAVPRGVMVTHSNVLANLQHVDQGWGHAPGTVMVTWLPIFHDLGLLYSMLQPLAYGFLCVMMPPAAFLQRPVRWLQAISRYRGTQSGGPNFAYDLCVQRVTEEQRRELDLHSWEVALNAAEPIRAETLDRFTAAFAGCGFSRRAFASGYGLAEATIKVTTTPTQISVPVLHLDSDELARNRIRFDENGTPLAGCGVAVPEMTLRIVDPSSQLPCGPLQIGEVWVRGGVVAKGYWRNDRATDEVFRARIAGGQEEFLRTGDLGFLHDGELFITGRLKDVIIIQGLNYYPQDIERAVEKSHPALAASGAGAFSLETDGVESVVVVAEIERTHSRSLVPEDVFRAIRAAVAEAQGLPLHAIALLQPKSLPRTSSGKVRRRTCRTEFVNGTLDTVVVWHAPAAPEAEITATRPSEPELREWLTKFFAERFAISPGSVDPHRSLAEYGLDSATAVSLANELEAWLHEPVAPTLAFDYPTIEAIGRKLCREAVSQRQRGLRQAGEAIAVVGMACRFPKARNTAEYWQLLINGVDAVGPLPPSRRENGDACTLNGGFLEDIDLFDAGFFAISPREATRTDPQQRLLLETAWEALEDAGIAASRLAGSRSGVFIGVSNSDYGRLMSRSEPGDIYLGTGSALSIAANRISYALDLRGPSLAIDSACSSSLVAVAMAVQALRRGDCEVALAGGVNLILTQEFTEAFANAKMLSPDGRCKSFDAAADGYGRGEGVGVVVLKRLTDAERDGDRILALVKGVAVNQDGRTAGLTAPNGPAQVEVVREALADAGIPPSRVSYVEAHGTGTPLGDPIEFNALQQVLGDRMPHQRCAVGSVKSNIGHLESAAGIAGFIKVVLALKHQRIPATLHVHNPNPQLNLEQGTLRIATSHHPWKVFSQSRVAGVSSFGFGGTNAHVVLEEYATAARQSSAADREFHVLTISARDQEALRDLAQSYAAQLSAQPDAFADVCFTANTGRSAMAERLAIVAPSASVAEASLQRWIRSGELSAAMRSSGKRFGRGVVFAYSGHGSHYASMGRELYLIEPVFRQALDRASEILQPLLDGHLAESLFSESVVLNDMRISQPAIFSVQYALTKLWASWGIEPAAVIGHSLGEFAAACAAGALSLEDALHLVAARGRLLELLPADVAMVTTDAPLNFLENVVRPHAQELSIAAFNASGNIVFSGRLHAAQQVIDQLTQSGFRAKALENTQAFHSPVVDPILDEFQQAASRISARKASIPLVSCHSGTWKNDAPDASYWSRHLREPVRYSDGVETLRNAGHSVFVEIGPHPVLTTIGRMFYSANDTTWHPSLDRRQPAHQTMLTSLAGLWLNGVSVDWLRVDAARERRKVSLPAYPFRRSRYWVQKTAASGRVTRGLLGTRVPIAAADAMVFENCLTAGTHLSTAAFVELALSAASASADRQWALEDVSILSADRSGGEIQTVLLAEADNWKWRIFHREENDASHPWRLCAQGIAASGAASAAMPSLDGAAIDAACSSAIAALPEAAGSAWYAEAIGRVSIAASPQPNVQRHAVCRGSSAEVLECDVSVTDPTGGTCISFEGLRLRKRTVPPASQAPTRWKIDWIPQPPLPESRGSRSYWVIFADTRGVGDRVAAQLAARGIATVRIRHGSSYQAEANHDYTIRPSERADFERAFSEIKSASGASPSGIVHLWSLDTAATLSAAALEQALDRASLSAVLALQSLLGAGLTGRMFLVTEGAQAIDDALTDHGLLQAPLWGIGKCIALEHPEHWGAMLDVEANDNAAGQIAAELLRYDPLPGEDHIAFRNGDRMVARIQPYDGSTSDALTTGNDGAYLISGGLGELGLAIARRLVASGARHLILMSRQGVSIEERMNAVRELEACGATVETPAIDVSCESDVAQYLAGRSAASAPLRGVIHAAGLPETTPLAEITRRQLCETLSAKAAGAIALRNATRGTRLHFFASVSSLSSGWGAAGQSAYVAASHFLDQFASLPWDPHCRAITIGLGPLLGGMLPPSAAVAMTRMGVTPWTMQRGAEEVLARCAAGPSHCIAAEIDWQRYGSVLQLRGRRALLKDVVLSQDETFVESDVVRRLANAPPSERERMLMSVIVREVCGVLHMDPAVEPDPRRGFFDLGMDSLTAIELKNRLERLFGQVLPPTLVFENPNIDALRTFIARDVLRWHQAVQPAPSAEPAAASTPLSADLDADIAASLEALEGMVQRI